MTRLRTMLPIIGWKRVRQISHKEAAELTASNTDKFMNKDYWILGELPETSGSQAVYLHDGRWWVVEKKEAQ